MAKKHLKGLEYREISGAMTLDGKFVAKNGFRLKDRKVKELSPEEIERSNRIEGQEIVNEDVREEVRKEVPEEDEPIV